MAKFKLTIVEVTTTPKLEARGLEIAKCNVPTEGFGLKREAMGSIINVLQSAGHKRRGDVVEMEGTLETSKFHAVDKDTKAPLFNADGSPLMKSTTWFFAD